MLKTITSHIVRKDFKEIMSIEFVSVTGGLLAGTMLSFATDKLYLLPGLFILLPGFLEMRGNINGSLAARLSSGMFVGAVKPRIRKNRIMNGNIAASMLLVIIVSAVLGLVAYAASSYFLGISTYKIILIALFAGILSNVIEIPLTIIATFWLFRHGHDPNNIMGPYVTTTGDIISIFALLVAMMVI